MAFTHRAGWRPPEGSVLKSTGSGGRYGALAVRFSGPDQKDLQQEYFTSRTEFAGTDRGSVPTLFNHGEPVDSAPIFKRFADRFFPNAQLKRLNNGIFAEVQLDPADKFQSALADLIEAGALRWSSGSTNQFVRKSIDGGITRWPIVEVSLTPSPAEPRLPKLRRM